MSWHVYMLECKNGNLYVGATNDLERRFSAHANGTGAKAVRMAGGPKQFIYTTPAENKSSAFALEYVIKSLRRAERLALANANHQAAALRDFLVNHGVLDDLR